MARSVNISSMTGFGRCEVLEGGRKFSAEIKSVNHRYLDVIVRSPKKMGPFEMRIRNLIKDYVERGKVDVSIGYEEYGDASLNIKYNKKIAQEYLDYCAQMSKDFSLANDMKVSDLSRLPEVFSMEDLVPDEEELWQGVEDSVKGALEHFLKAREEEGERLKEDMLDKLSQMKSHVDFITEKSPMIVESYRENLKAKVKDLLGDASMDEGRILTEVALFADRVCVDEELVRLESHISQTMAELNKGGPVGRKLDFLAQEMNREANTILSKTTDLEVSGHAIELKTQIEKIREQVQNIE